jgi:hypothetical protein
VDILVNAAKIKKKGFIAKMVGQNVDNLPVVYQYIILTLYAPSVVYAQQ